MKMKLMVIKQPTEPEVTYSAEGEEEVKRSVEEIAIELQKVNLELSSLTGEIESMEDELQITFSDIVETKEATHG